MNDITVEQGSYQWIENRLGKCTASRVYDIMPGKRGAYRASRKAYMLELLAERITGRELDNYVSKAMEWGIAQEGEARSVYEALSGNLVTEVGFIEHPTIEGLGGSADGLIGDNGSIEIKNPNTTTHLELIATGDINSKYMYQMQTVMMCCNREYCDYIDYDSRCPEFAQYFTRRINADAQMQLEIETEAVRFLAELDKLEDAIRSHE